MRNYIQLNLLSLFHTSYICAFLFLHPSVQTHNFLLIAIPDLLIFLALASVVRCLCHLSWKPVLPELDERFISVLIPVIDKCDEAPRLRKGPVAVHTRPSSGRSSITSLCADPAVQTGLVLLPLVNNDVTDVNKATETKSSVPAVQPLKTSLFQEKRI